MHFASKKRPKSGVRRPWRKCVGLDVEEITRWWREQGISDDAHRENAELTSTSNPGDSGWKHEI